MWKTLRWGGTIGITTCTDAHNHPPTIETQEIPDEKKSRSAPITILGKYKMYMMRAIFRTDRRPVRRR